MGNETDEIHVHLPWAIILKQLPGAEEIKDVKVAARSGADKVHILLPVFHSFE